MCVIYAQCLFFPVNFVCPISKSSTVASFPDVDFSYAPFSSAASLNGLFAVNMRFGCAFGDNDDQHQPLPENLHIGADVGNRVDVMPDGLMDDFKRLFFAMYPFDTAIVINANQHGAAKGVGEGGNGFGHFRRRMHLELEFSIETFPSGNNIKEGRSRSRPADEVHGVPPSQVDWNSVRR